MQEKILHNFWQWLKPATPLITIDGCSVFILDPGKLNRHQGPDFINAKISIDNTIYVGDVEIHLKTSGWVQHCHHLDSWYQKVILHVVWENDQDPRLLSIPYPPHTLQLNSFFSKEQLYSHSTFPALNELQLAAEERLLRKHHGFSHLKLTGGSYHYQLYISLWQACGYPHNQAGFTQFAKWLFPFLKKNYTPYNKENIFPLLSYWLKAANLWECFGRLAVYSQFGDKNPQIPKTSNRLFPSSISWNMGKIHPVNHPVLKIWEFIALLSQTCWPNICERIVSAITSRNPASQLLKNLENILILPKTVNGIKHWHTKNRLIEWLMSAALPLSMSYYSFRNEYGMKNYLHELYYTLPAGYNYHKNQFNLEFKYAWQYQGLLEWISKKRGMEGVERRANS